MNARLPCVALPLGLRTPIALVLAFLLVRPVVGGDTGAPASAAGGAVGSSDQPVASDRETRRDGSQPLDTPVDASDLVRFNNESASHYFITRSSRLQPEYYFFPPDPPPLGAELRLFRPIGTGLPASPELAQYVNEPFYPVLGVRLAAEDLPHRLQLALAEYRAAKTELQNELRTRIAQLKDADPETCRRQLATLGRMQAPRIAELETTAERLRTDLLRNGLYGVIAGHGDWNEGRSWHLAARGEEKTLADPQQMEFEVMRAAVYYQDGLSPAQRRLVREIAMELQAEIWKSAEPAQTTKEVAPFFFSPETAQIRVPADLPAELAGRIDAYVSEKRGLKAELRETIRSCDALGADERTRALQMLAAKQAPRIAELEERAETIRLGLVVVPDMPGPPAPPPLPAELGARISVYRAHKLDLLKALHAMLAQPAPAARSRPKTLPAQEEVAEFNREHAAQFADLRTEKNGIREALAQYVRGGQGMRDRKSIDDLLEEFENSRQRQEVWEKYREYQVAVLMPGLAPEQRRLLFDAAVEKLALPLPDGKVPR